MSDLTFELAIPTNIWRTLLDEDCFFRWLYAIPGYETCKGIGRTLYISFDDELFEDWSLREIVALFYRYEIPNMTDLKMFSASRFGKEFSAPDVYWHTRIFGDPGTL